MPGDMRPGTEWGIMWGFSGDVTLWVLFGGRPGLELKHGAEKEENVGERRGGRLAGGGGVVWEVVVVVAGGVNIWSTPECNSIPNS